MTPPNLREPRSLKAAIDEVRACLDDRTELGQDGYATGDARYGDRYTRHAYMLADALAILERIDGNVR